MNSSQLQLASCSCYFKWSTCTHFFSYHKLFSLVWRAAVRVFKAALIFRVSSCVAPRCVYCCFLYGQPARLHHSAAPISSSIREHRLSLSLLTYSSETSLLFEKWWTDVQSIDEFSCCNISADEKGGLIYALHSWLCHEPPIWVTANYFKTYSSLRLIVTSASLLLTVSQILFIDAELLLSTKVFKALSVHKHSSH